MSIASLPADAPVYLDTSALLPYYRSEPSSDAVQAFLLGRTGTVVISALTRTEVASTLARWVRAGELDEAAANRVESAFHADLGAGRFRIAPLPPERFDRAIHWLLARTTSLRTLDALHLACAEAGDTTLVTLDAAFATAARHLGIATHELGKA